MVSVEMPGMQTTRLTLIIREFKCYEVKIEESEKAGSHWESNPGHLWLEPLVLSGCQVCK